MRDRQAREKQRNDRYHRAHQHTAQYAAHGVAGDDQPIRQRRNQQLLDVLAEFRAEERRNHIAIGSLNHVHHDDAGRHELHVVEAAHLADATPDQAAEYHEVKGGCDGGRHDGLPPDAHDAAEFADDDGCKTNPIGAETRFRHAHEAFAAAVRTLPSTKRMNSSSRRLTLLRMLFTAMPCAESCANMSFKLCVLDISISSVCSSERTAVNPDIFGAMALASRKLNTNTSVCSLRSTFAMLSRSMILPPSIMAMLRHRFSASSR